MYENYSQLQIIWTISNKSLSTNYKKSLVIKVKRSWKPGKSKFPKRFQKTPNNEALQKGSGKNEFTRSSECESHIAKKKQSSLHIFEYRQTELNYEGENMKKWLFTSNLYKVTVLTIPTNS